MKRYFHSHFLPLRYSPSPLFCISCIANFTSISLSQSLSLSLSLSLLSVPHFLSASASSFSPFAHFHTDTDTHMLTLPAASCCTKSLLLLQLFGAQGADRQADRQPCNRQQATCSTCILSRARFAFRLHFRLLIIATLSVSLASLHAPSQLPQSKNKSESNSVSLSVSDISPWFSSCPVSLTDLVFSLYFIFHLQLHFMVCFDR